MAGFELARIGTVTEAAREWHIGRYIPLYLAGIVGGVALGIGVTHAVRLEPATQPYTASSLSAPATDLGAGVTNAADVPTLDVVNYYVPDLPPGFMAYVAPAAPQRRPHPPRSRP